MTHSEKWTRSAVLFCSFLLLLLSPTVGSALPLGQNITIWDKMGTGSGWEGGPHEDQEIEPNCVSGQVYDLEGFFLNSMTLSLVSGYDLVNGVDDPYRPQHYDSGDIFIDVDHDAEYGDDVTGSGGGNQVINNIFGYDYVLDLDFSALTYSVYSINSGSTVTVYFGQNDESNPWRYNSGGALLPGLENVSFSDSYWANQPDSEVDDLQGDNHYVASFDVSFVGNADYILTHFTYECGNDNLIGEADLPGDKEIPDASAFLLLGSAVAAFGLFRKRDRQSGTTKP